MNDTTQPDLLPIPQSEPDPIERARRRLAVAQAAYDRAEASDEEFDGFGPAVYENEERELRFARKELASAERWELERRQNR